MRTTTAALAAAAGFLPHATTGQSAYTPANLYNPKKELRIWIEASTRATVACGLGGVAEDSIEPSLSTAGGPHGRGGSGHGLLDGGKQPRRGPNSIQKTACDPELALNVTSTALRREFWGAIDRCPNPWVSLGINTCNRRRRGLAAILSPARPPASTLFARSGRTMCRGRKHHRWRTKQRRPTTAKALTRPTPTP